MNDIERDIKRLETLLELAYEDYLETKNSALLRNIAAIQSEIRKLRKELPEEKETPQTLSFPFLPAALVYHYYNSLIRKKGDEEDAKD